MKLFVYVTDIEEALKGVFDWSLAVSTRDDFGGINGDYALVSEIEVELNLDREALTKSAVDTIDNKIKDIQATATAAVTSLEARQQNLLSLTHQT